MEESTKQQIKDALKEHLEQCNEQTSKQLTGVFLYGIVTGIILSYSGILGFSSGIGAGMFFRHQHNTTSTAIIDTVVSRFTSSWANVKKNI